MKRYFLILMAVLMALALAAGCGAKSQSSDYYEMPSEPTIEGGYAIDDSDYSSEAPASGEGFYESSAQGVDVGEVYGGRKIIRNYDISMYSDDFDNVYSTISDKLAEFEGYVQNSNVDGKKPETYGESGRIASLTLRVPSVKADEFISGVKTLGSITSIRDYADDITDSYYDVDTRLEVLRVQLDRLQGILVQTDNLADVIALEDRISEVMLEIEQLTGTLKKYDMLIDYTTVNITIYERSLIAGPAAEKTTGERIGEGFTSSLYGVGKFFTDLFVWFVSALPVIIVLAVIAVAVYFIVRACTKRSRIKRAESAAKAAVIQQSLFEQQKAAYMAQQNSAQDAGKGEDTDEK